MVYRKGSDRNQLFKFILAGTCAAVVNLTSRFFLDLIFSFEVAVTLSLCCGVVVGYVLMRTFVFEPPPHRSPNEFMRFLLVNVLALGLTLVSTAVALFLSMKVFTDVEIAKFVAHGFGVACPVVLSFVAHRNFTFRMRRMT